MFLEAFNYITCYEANANVTLSPYQIKHLPRGDKYPHIVNVATAKTATLDEVHSEAKINGNEKINMEGLLLNLSFKVSNQITFYQNLLEVFLNFISFVILGCWHHLHWIWFAIFS